MAGDWIKMRLSLQTHPKVVRILSATKTDKFRVIGGLHAVWAVFDTHSVDGKLDGYTPEALDHIIGWPGFSDALVAVGWLLVEGADALLLPEFDEHNGTSGKRRAEDQKRKRDSRKNPQIVTDESGQIADKLRTREEKRREEENLTSAGAPDVVVDRRKKPRGNDEDYTCARWLYSVNVKINPGAKKPNLDTWANDIRLMREIDNRSHREICELYQFAKNDSFWSPNIQCPANLRKKWDTLIEKKAAAAPVAPPAMKKDWI